MQPHEHTLGQCLNPSEFLSRYPKAARYGAGSVMIVPAASVSVVPANCLPVGDVENVSTGKELSTSMPRKPQKYLGMIGGFA